MCANIAQRKIISFINLGKHLHTVPQLSKRISVCTEHFTYRCLLKLSCTSYMRIFKVCVTKMFIFLKKVHFSLGRLFETINNFVPGYEF